MESIRCPSPSLPPHSFLGHHSAQPRRRSAQLLLLTKSPKHRHNLVFLAISPTQQKALSNSLNAAATAPAAAGDLSVLVPISALLLSIYWIANFIVPGMIAKELQPATSEQEAGTEEDKEEGMAKPPNLKIKDIRGMKKTTTPL